MGGNSSKQKNLKSPREILEIEECEDLELDDPTNTLLKRCSKNPEHKDFIQVKDFNLGCLPEAIRDDSILNYVLAHEKLVVRIAVAKTSPDRPKESSEIELGLSATGYAWCSGEKDYQMNSVPDNMHSGIIVYTNRHVIYDDYEAKHSKVRFFYNEKDKDGNYVEAVGYGLREVSTKKDLVGLEVHFKDERLYDQVSNFHRETAKAWRAVPQPYKEAFKNHAVIISHPHGAVKVITVGDLLVLEEEEETEKDLKTPRENDDDIVQEDTVTSPKTVKQLRKKTQYNTPTCSGSSGAPVLTGYYHDPEKPFTHSSTKRNSSNINFSVSY